MPRKTTIDLVNDPVKLAVKMLQSQKEAAVSNLRSGRKVSALRKALPEDMTMIQFAELLSGEKRASNN